MLGYSLKRTSEVINNEVEKQLLENKHIHYLLSGLILHNFHTNRTQQLKIVAAHMGGYQMYDEVRNVSFRKKI